MSSDLNIGIVQKLLNTVKLIYHYSSNAGVSRSTSIAMAYVIHKEKIPLDTALERLRQTRPSVKPNEAFMEQLRQLEQNLGILCV